MTRRWQSAAVLGLCLLVAATAASQYRPGEQYNRGQRPAYRPQERETRQPAYRPQYDDEYERARGRDTRSYSADVEGRQRPMGNDQRVATMLALGNQMEIKLGQYVARRAENSDVREFAERLAQDHRIMLSQLNAFSPRIADTSRDQRSSQEGYERDRQSDERYADRRTVARQWDELTIAQRVHDRAFQKARDELGEKDGLEVDMCFLAQQAVMHQQSLAKHEVLRQYASADLREVIDEGIEILEGHIGETERLMEDIKHEAAEEITSSDRRERRSEESWDEDESEERGEARRDRDESEESRSEERRNEEDRRERSDEDSEQ